MASPEAATPQQSSEKRTESLETVVIRFCGDSGDGMQLAGTQFTNVSAAFGNDVSTLPDFPAEIRAPAGSLSGVSGFQLRFSSHDIYTPGDAVDTLAITFWISRTSVICTTVRTSKMMPEVMLPTMGSAIAAPWAISTS